MNVIIIEDELPAARRLKRMLLEIAPEFVILEIIDSIDLAVDYLNTTSSIDLIFMDIQLADGSSFEIFNQVNIQVPVIFATAFDEYAVMAFKVNGLDYLLKPIESEDLMRAINKFKERNKQVQLDYKEIIDLFTKKENIYKKRFLVKKGDELVVIETNQIAYFQADAGYVTITTHSGTKYLIDSSLDSLKSQLPPSQFFQINRQFIVNIKGLAVVNTWFNNRLKVKLVPRVDGEITVSRERVKDFKIWLDS